MESLGLVPIFQAMYTAGYTLICSIGVSEEFHNSSESLTDMQVATFTDIPELCIIQLIQYRSYSDSASGKSRQSYPISGSVVLVNDSSKTRCIRMTCRGQDTDNPVMNTAELDTATLRFRLAGNMLQLCDIPIKFIIDLMLMVYAFKKA